MKDLAVCFDLDGTLFDPEILAEQALYEAAGEVKTLGILRETALEEMLELRQRFSSGNPRHFFTEYLKKYEVTNPDLVSSMVVSFYKAMDLGLCSISPFDGVYDTLEELSKKTHIALVTNGHENTQRKKIDALGLSKYFNGYVYISDNDPLKAKPLGYLWNQAVGGRDAVHVGDSDFHDVMGGNLQGLKTIKVGSKNGHISDEKVESVLGYVPNDLPRLLKPDYRIKHIRSLRNVLYQ
jgi:FMN phosphatase YigB (HAD superfamily)